MIPMKPGECLDVIVDRCLHTSAARAWGDVPTTPYSTSFAACETALKWLREQDEWMEIYSLGPQWRLAFSARNLRNVHLPPLIETLPHAIALAVFAVGVAKGIVDEKGNLK